MSDITKIYNAESGNTYDINMPIIDVTSSFTLNSSGGWSVAFFIAKKYGKLVTATFKVSNSASSLVGLTLYTIPTELTPITTFIQFVASESTQGRVYMVNIDNSLRFDAVGMNSTYTSGSTVSGSVSWLTN